MKSNLLRFAALLVLLSSLKLSSQNYDITNVKRVNPNDIKAIIENNEIKGYYAFYFIDKENKKENLYNLSILDNNLKQTHSIEIVKSKKLLLLESSYNGERFCFSFIDLADRKLEYLILDKTGKKTGDYKIEVSKAEANLYASRLKTEEDVSAGTLAAIKGKGFLRFGYEKEEGERIDIEMIDNSGKKIWEANSHATSKKSYESMAPMLIDDKVVIAGLQTKEKLMSTKIKYAVLILNSETGKEITRLEGKDEKYQFSPLGASLNEVSKTYFVFGQYFYADDDILRDDARGMFILEVDGSGTVIARKMIDWEKEINPMLVSKSRKKLEKNMKTFIHKVVKTADGKLFAIGEQYRKAVSGKGAALNMLGANVSVMKIEMHDMITFEFDQDIKLVDVTLFEKEKSNVDLPEGWGTMDANIMGYFMKLYGYFDYDYTAVSADRKTFNSAYTNYDRDPDAGSNYTIGNISYTKDKKLVQDKIKLTTKPTVFYVRPARPGYIAIFEYFKKSKKAVLRLEKLNL